MTQAKLYQFIIYITYSIFAGIGSKFLDIHWIHVLNALILSTILYQILEWKYDWIGGEENNADETTNN